MNIYSKRLEKTIEFKTEQYNELELISHQSIVEVFSELPEMDVSYEIISSDTRHSVILCTVSDQEGNCITEIGEALSISLANEISRMYPTTMAFTRAFDRAVLRYLMLPGKNYSNAEILKEGRETPEALQIIPDVKPSEEGPVKDVNWTGDSESHLSDFGSVRIAIGKYKKNPVTVKELVNNEKEASWIEFVIDKFADWKGHPYQTQANALREYLRRERENEINNGD